MSDEVEYDERADVWRIIVDGKPLMSGDGYPMGFESRQAADEAVESRNDLRLLRRGAR